MATSKELFLRAEPELAKWWVGIARDDRFGRVLCFCRAAMLENNCDRAQIQGVQAFIKHMETIADNEDSAGLFPEPGLHHFAETAQPKPKPE